MADNEKDVAPDDEKTWAPAETDYGVDGPHVGTTESTPVEGPNGTVVEPVTNPLWQSATVSTDGTGPHTEDVTPIFAQSRQQALVEAVDAVDNGEVPANVVLPDDTTVPEDNDEALANLRDAADAATAGQDAPVKEDVTSKSGDEGKATGAKAAAESRATDSGATSKAAADKPASRKTADKKADDDKK